MSTPARPRTVPTRSDAATAAWALALAVLLLGPALGPGYVLSYDMVWVPDLALRPDFLGVGSGLPRAVPSDAVIALLDEVLPGMVLQKLVLLGSLVGAALGADRLLGERVLVARLFVVSLVVWSPFVVERLLLGAWPVLLGYAALPWVVDAARSWRATGRMPRRLLVLVPLGSLSASAGVATGAALLLLASGPRRRVATVLVAAGVVLAANAPWLVSGLLHAASATSDALGAKAFALRDEGAVPGPLAALSLGGVWNTEVVPSARTGPLGWLALVAVVGLAVAGLLGRRWAVDRREVVGLVACWVLGWGLAVLTWAAPGALGVLVATVPGAGLVRDGSRLLVLCLPLLVVLTGSGVALLVRRFPRQPVARASLGTACVLLPVALLPGAALGLAGGPAGGLHAVDYPASYAQAREVVARQHTATGGDVLALPASSYRQPAWNAGAKVLDPIGRYLTPDYVASDELVVDGVLIPGEDPRFRRVLAALARPDPAARTQALARAGIGLVVQDRTAPGAAPEVAGTVLLDEADLLVTALADPVPGRTPTSWWVLMTLAWAAYVALPAAAAGSLVRTTRATRAARGRRMW